MIEPYISYEIIATRNRILHTQNLCDLVEMEPKDRLKLAREKAGFKTPSDAARSIRELNVNTLISNENGNALISKKMAQRYADAFGVTAGWLLFGDGAGLDSGARAASRPTINIVGEVAAGVWLERNVFEADSVTKSSVAGGDARFLPAHQYILRIRGESLNRIAQDGDYLLCLDYGLAGVDIESGDLVIVERSRDSGLTIERTAKRAFRGNREIELRPESSDPRFQEPITYDEHDEETTEVQIIAKVLWILKEA